MSSKISYTETGIESIIRERNEHADRLIETSRDSKNNAGGWKQYAEMIESQSLSSKELHDKRRQIVLMLENVKNKLKYSEASRTSNIGSWEKYAFQTITYAMNELSAMDWVSWQTMPAPVALVFFFNIIFGSNKGEIVKGDRMWSAKDVVTSSNYSSRTIDGEVIGNAGAGSEQSYQGMLQYVPVLSSTITITGTSSTNTAITVIDDGAGNLKEGASTIGTINYTTGSYNFTLVATPLANSAIKIKYDFQMEGSSNIGEVDFSIDKVTMEAIDQMLQTKFTERSNQDLMHLYGVNADEETAKAMGMLLGAEKDQIIFSDLLNDAVNSENAPYSLSPWNKRIPVGVSWQDHRKSFLDHLLSLQSVVYGETHRVMPNRICVGFNGANIIMGMKQDGVFEAPPGGIKESIGIHYIGTLNNMWKVYRNPKIDTNQILMGFKGNDNLFHAGYLVGDYISFHVTPLFQAPNNVNTRGVLSTWARKMINKSFFVKSRIVDQAYV